MFTLEGRPGNVLPLAFCPASDRLASAETGGRVRLWAPPTEVGVLTGHTDTVQALAFSPDGRYLATGGADRVVHVWDMRDQRLGASSGPHPHPITAIAFVAPGTVLFGIGEQPGPVARPTTLFLLDLPVGKVRRFPFDVVNGIRAVATLPDRKLAAWATDNKLLRFQDISRPPGPAAVLRHDCRAIALSPDARWLAVTADWEIVIHDLEGWPRRSHTLGRHQGGVSAVAFGPDGRTLFSGGRDNTVRVWDLDRGTERHRYSWPIGNRVVSLAVSPDGLRAAASGDSGAVAVWDLD